MTAEDAYHELCAYTLGLPRAEFVHQHVVDAYAVQTAHASTKPIRLTFGLVGLCLLLDHRWNGLQVQRAHLDLARTGKDWPRFPLPDERGELTARDVLVVPEGPARVERIRDWCGCVWAAFSNSHPPIRALLRDRGVLPSDT